MLKEHTQSLSELVELKSIPVDLSMPGTESMWFIYHSVGTISPNRRTVLETLQSKYARNSIRFAWTHVPPRLADGSTAPWMSVCCNEKNGDCAEVSVVLRPSKHKFACIRQDDSLEVALDRVIGGDIKWQTI